MASERGGSVMGTGWVGKLLDGWLESGRACFVLVELSMARSRGATALEGRVGLRARDWAAKLMDDLLNGGRAG